MSNLDFEFLKNLDLESIEIIDLMENTQFHLYNFFGQNEYRYDKNDDELSLIIHIFQDLAYDYHMLVTRNKYGKFCIEPELYDEVQDQRVIKRSDFIKYRHELAQLLYSVKEDLLNDRPISICNPITNKGLIHI